MPVILAEYYSFRHLVTLGKQYSCDIVPKCADYRSYLGWIYYGIVNLAGIVRKVIAPVALTRTSTGSPRAINPPCSVTSVRIRKRR
jgi:hypothetical protein